ncbi:hypothetical protein HanXRQr2_Chr01g0012551 [Helianthus annuus]|uniref:Uncharacterized protein n=1 Tax=Helianthus annuus TaxID=4232 RepID=A0A251VNB9_HELAN|nr:hypothetical protein HanXRQr2_Chr01g0012551 [Helianthus annuus]
MNMQILEFYFKVVDTLDANILEKVYWNDDTFLSFSLRCSMVGFYGWNPNLRLFG